MRSDCEDGEDRDGDVRRPDGNYKGRGGFEEDYDFIMYGKVCISSILDLLTLCKLLACLLLTTSCSTP